MRILHVTKKYMNALGGDSIVVANLRKQQIKSGHEVFILTSNCDDIIDDKSVIKFGLKDVAAELDNITPRRIISLVALFFSFLILIRRVRPDIVHTHSPDMAFVVGVLAKLFKIPLVHTCHSIAFNDSNIDKLRRNLELTLLRGAMAKIFTAPNQVAVAALRDKKINAELLLNGVDLQLWSPDASSAGSYKTRKFTFVSTGRLEEAKGNKYLIEALAMLSTADQNVQLFIVGDGSQRQELEQYAEHLGVSDKVTFYGYKNIEEMKAIYAQSNVYILYSTGETGPLTLLEAWASNLPSIATPVGILQGRPAGEGDVALIVSPKDSKSLMRAMTRIKSDERLRGTLVAHSTKEVQKYNWPEIAKNAELIYKRASMI